MFLANLRYLESKQIISVSLQVSKVGSTHPLVSSYEHRQAHTFVINTSTEIEINHKQQTTTHSKTISRARDLGVCLIGMRFASATNCWEISEIHCDQSTRHQVN